MTIDPGEGSQQEAVLYDACENQNGDFLGFNTTTGAHPIRVLSLFDGISSGTVFLCHVSK